MGFVIQMAAGKAEARPRTGRTRPGRTTQPAAIWARRPRSRSEGHGIASSGAPSRSRRHRHRLGQLDRRPAVRRPRRRASSSTASSAAPASTSAASRRRCTSTRPTSPSTSGTRAGSASTPRWTRCAGATSATAIFGRIDPISAGGHDYRANRSPNVTLYDGHARFTGPKQLAVDGATLGTELTADRIVIAAGSRPVIPDVPGARRAAPHVRHGHADRRRCPSTW